jgi:endonuclease YncB( thermonuclease family)
MKSLAFVAAVALSPSLSQALTAEFPICSSGEPVTCIVDGDTIWYEGIKIHLEDIDMPKRGALAGCMDEALLSMAATNRLAEILSDNMFTIETEDKLDNYDRVLARLIVNGASVGETLIEEGLARPWAERREEWCK